jgi:hypothetical protein
MWAGREARTSRRNLVSGVPTGADIQPLTGPALDEAAVRGRYSSDEWEAPPPDADLIERARVLHQHARRMLLVDGEHVMIAWLFRGGTPSHNLHSTRRTSRVTT